MNGVEACGRQISRTGHPSAPLMPNHTWFLVAALVVVCTMTKDRLSVGNNSRHMALPDELNDFEEEGGLEAPGSDLVDVLLDYAIWRRPRWVANQTNQQKITL
jgi:hypothetical protein